MGAAAKRRMSRLAIAIDQAAARFRGLLPVLIATSASSQESAAPNK
jgi:hypothetical protein